jgi:hypothetical protein
MQKSDYKSSSEKVIAKKWSQRKKLLIYRKLHIYVYLHTLIDSLTLTDNYIYLFWID